MRRSTYKARPGIETTLAIRWILDNCSNATEATQYLEKIPHAQASAFLIGDKKGTLVKGECTPEKINITLFNDFVIVNNFFQSEQMKHLEKNMPETDRAYRSHWTIKNWILKHKGTITTSSVKEVCKGHENGICEHLEDGGTIWSWIAELGTGVLEMAEGYPCKNDYKQFTL
ncbi:MAG: carcinine hydrolase/isopenicillin-N N-acyltransferase family protein [Promethearchaeota archaeon]